MFSLKISLLLISAILLIPKSECEKEDSRLYRLNYHTRKVYNDQSNCLCYPDGQLPTAHQLLDSLHKGQERLVIYLYKNVDSNEIVMFTPNIDKQLHIPDVPYEIGDRLDAVTTEPISTIFYNSPNKIKIHNHSPETTSTSTFNSLPIGLNEGIIEHVYPKNINNFIPNNNSGKPNEYVIDNLDPQKEIVSEAHKESIIFIPNKNNPEQWYFSKEEYDVNPDITDQLWWSNKKESTKFIPDVGHPNKEYLPKEQYDSNSEIPDQHWWPNKKESTKFVPVPKGEYNSNPDISEQDWWPIKIESSTIIPNKGHSEKVYIPNEDYDINPEFIEEHWWSNKKKSINFIPKKDYPKQEYLHKEEYYNNPEIIEQHWWTNKKEVSTIIPNKGNLDEEYLPKQEYINSPDIIKQHWWPNKKEPTKVISLIGKNPDKGNLPKIQYESNPEITNEHWWLNKKESSTSIPNKGHPSKVYISNEGYDNNPEIIEQHRWSNKMKYPKINSDKIVLNTDGLHKKVYIFPAHDKLHNNQGVQSISTSHEVHRPYNSFDEWFKEQLLRFQNINLPYDIKNIDNNVLKLLVIKMLSENNIHVSPDGVITDSRGKIIDVANLELRPTFIGQKVRFKIHKNKNVNTKIVLPKHLPYLEGILVAFVHPPHVVGIIPIGKAYLTAVNGSIHVNSYPDTESQWSIDNEHDSTTSTKAAGRRNSGSIEKSNSQSLPSPYIYSSISNQLNSGFSEVSHKNEPHFVVTEESYSYQTSGDRKKSTDAKIQHLLKPSQTRKNENLLNDEKKLNQTEVADKESPLLDPISNLNDTESGRRFPLPSLQGVMKTLLSLLDAPSQGESKTFNATDVESVSESKDLRDGDESPDFRIIGGNAATGSGTPLSMKGRSGHEGA